MFRIYDVWHFIKVCNVNTLFTMNILIKKKPVDIDIDWFIDCCYCHCLSSTIDYVMHGCRCHWQIAKGVGYRICKIWILILIKINKDNDGQGFVLKALWRGWPSDINKTTVHTNNAVYLYITEYWPGLITQIYFGQGNLHLNFFLLSVNDTNSKRVLHITKNDVSRW